MVYNVIPAGKEGAMSRHILALAGLSVGLWALVLIDSPERFFSGIAYLNLGVLSLVATLLAVIMPG